MVNSIKGIASSKKGVWILGVISFFNAFIIIFPTDILLSYFVLNNSSRRFFYTFITTFTSILGSIVGYFLGYFFFHQFKNDIFYTLSINQAQFDYISDIYSQYGYFVLLLSNIPPLSHKLICFLAGAFHLNIYIFIPIIILNRFSRYLLVTLFAYHVSNRYSVVKKINTYLLIIIMIVILIITIRRVL